MIALPTQRMNPQTCENSPRMYFTPDFFPLIFTFHWGTGECDKPALCGTFGLARILFTNRWDDVKLDGCVRGHQRVEWESGDCWGLRAYGAHAAGATCFRPTLPRVRVEQFHQLVFQQVIISSHICLWIRLKGHQQRTHITCIIDSTSRTVKKKEKKPKPYTDPVE